MKRVASLVALWLVLPAPFVASAQDPPVPPLVEMLTIQIKPDMTAEYETLIGELRDATRQADPDFYLVYRVERGGGGHYIRLRPVNSFAELDEPVAAFQAMGEEAFTRWLARYNKTIVDRQFDTLRTLLDLSNPLAEGRQPQLAVLQTRRNLPGMRDEYMAWLRDQYVPALRDAGRDGVFQFRNAHGGRLWYQLQLVDNWASFDEPDTPIGTAIGRAGGQLTTAPDVKVLRLLPELSILPGQQ